MTILQCTQCGAKVTTEELDYAETYGEWYGGMDSHNDCGCFSYNEEMDMECCQCLFIKKSTIKKHKKHER